MRPLILFFLAIGIFLTSLNAQPANRGNAAGTLDDYSRINLNIYIPPASMFLDQSLGVRDTNFIKQTIGTRLRSIMARHGFTGADRSPRFMVFPTLTLIDRYASGTAPPQEVIVLQLDLFVADFVDHKTYATTSLQLKGVDRSPERALRSAMRDLRDSKKVEQFLIEGKTEILRYYNDQCDFIMQEVETLAEIQRFEMAFQMLLQVPQACSDCYARAMEKLPYYYAKYDEHNCQTNLQKARTSWAAKKKSIELGRSESSSSSQGNTDVIGDNFREGEQATGNENTQNAEVKAKIEYNEVYESISYLNKIMPDSPCFPEAQQLLEEIKQYVEDEKFFEERTKYQDQKELSKLKIERSAEVATEYYRSDAEYWRNQERNAFEIFKF